MNNWKGIFTIKQAQRAIKRQSRYATLDSSFLPAHPSAYILIAMHLTLFVPDLHWPDIGNRNAYDFKGAEVLARVLSSATRTTTPLAQTDSWESRLAQLFGFAATRPPLAALRSLGDGQPQPGRVLCADPVNLSFIQQAMVLSPITIDASANHQAEQDIPSLVDSLNAEFVGEGHFYAMPASAAAGADDACRWYFVPDDAVTDLPDLAACSRLAGRRIDADETRQLLGSKGLQWINRIQICLNQHPVNAAREAGGLPVINSLWPWGLGQLETTPERTFQRAVGESPMLKGLCHATNTPLESPRAFGADPAASAHELVAQLGLASAVQQDDLDAWQTRMTQLIEDWVSPALNALMDRRQPLKTLRLISPGTHQETTWVVHNNDRALCGNLLQRFLGIHSKPPALQSLLGS